MYKYSNYPLRILFISIIFSFFSTTSLPANELKSICIVGFINTGDSRDDNINIQLTKSLIAYLSKFAKSITPYSSIEDIAKNKFWKLKRLDESQAIRIAQSFDTKEVLTGDYYVNNKNDTLIVNVKVYDVVTGELKLKRTYKGSTGRDIFDTIDHIILEVSGLLIGTKLEFGKIIIIVPAGKGPYSLYVNGMLEAVLSNRISYEYETFANQEVLISLRLSDVNKEVLQKTIIIEKDKATNIVYTPSGSILIKTHAISNQVYLNGSFSGVTSINGELTISSLPTDIPITVQIKSTNRILAEERVNLHEGDLTIVYAGLSDNGPSAINYTRLNMFLFSPGGLLVGLLAGFATFNIEWQLSLNNYFSLYLTPAYELNWIKGWSTTNFTTTNSIYEQYSIFSLDIGFLFMPCGKHLDGWFIGAGFGTGLLTESTSTNQIYVFYGVFTAGYQFVFNSGFVLRLGLGIKITSAQMTPLIFGNTTSGPYFYTKLELADIGFAF